jgi:uncharacterized tellurite resistance protein B-like protein
LPIALILIALAIAIFVAVTMKNYKPEQLPPPDPMRQPRTKGVDAEQSPTGPERHDSSFARIAAVRAIRDPRDAALVLMIAMIQLKGELSATDIQTIQQEAEEMFGSASGDIAARLAAVRISTGGVGYELALSEVKTLLNRSLTAIEKHQLWKAVKNVAEVDGKALQDQLEMLDRTEQALDLIQPEGKAL